ncbi:MAG: Serine-type D-Ala-D-Ala carboxypeptidase [Acidimicrobiales bacterium]|nr:Serine-type D-Ala-D-Ala carboxypeptidase [Acidimicrobiales bacterium]
MRPAAWRLLVVLFVVPALLVACGSSSNADPGAADKALDKAINGFVKQSGGPPGVAVAIQRGNAFRLHTAGVADTSTGAAITADDVMRLASVAKAFSGATALAVVAAGAMSLDDTLGKRLPDLPAAWSAVTLRQLLAHTSGLPDFSKNKAFLNAVRASLLVPPPHRELLRFVEGEPLNFAPGTQYLYSNSDNIAAALMIEAATGRPYETELRDRVLTPLSLGHTSLPNDVALPAPRLSGYTVEPPQPPEDVTELIAAGWTWASGGVVSTPADATRFVRGYVRGATTNSAIRTQQFRFATGGQSEPPGPGTNSAGVAIFRYRTRCGTVYGHTGNTPGYTQFVAATPDGRQSVTVAVNAQITPTADKARFPDLRHIFELGVCAALAG